LPSLCGKDEGHDQDRLRKTLDSFTVLSRTGFPPLSRHEMVEQLWAIARVPGHALQKLSDSELQAKFQEVLAAVNSGPGRAEIKVGDHTLKFTVGEGGTVTGSECSKPGFWSRVGGALKKVAPIALTVLSFILVAGSPSAQACIRTREYRNSGARSAPFGQTTV